MRRFLAFFTLFSLLLSGNAYSESATYEKEIEKKIKCPQNFSENPPLYFYCIYRDYHNHEYDAGILKAEKALREIIPLYRKDPKSLIPNHSHKNAKLRDPRTYKVLSDLYMLLGMLYYGKALNYSYDREKMPYKEFFSKLQERGFGFIQVNELLNLYTLKKLFPSEFGKKEERRYKELLSKMGVSEAEIDEVVKKAKEISEEESRKRLSFLRKAVECLNKAVEVDPENGLAYYQLGNLYSGALSEGLPEESEAAEEAYYKAAIIFKKQGDMEAYKEVLKKLELANPKSKFLEKLKSKGNA